MNVLNETCLLYAILACTWLKFSWECYLAFRQLRLCKKTTTVPRELADIMPQETFDKSRSYLLDRIKLSFVKETFSQLLNTNSLLSGELGQTWMYADSISPFANEVAVTCTWLLLVGIASSLTNLPFEMYDVFMLEGEYGFNNQTMGFFLRDKLLGFVIEQILTVFSGSLFVIIVKNSGKYLLLWMCLGQLALTMLVLSVYPTYIAPLFDTYSSLPQGDLRREIEALASSLNFPLQQIYVVEGSNRSSHTNAYFYGFFQSKRIVLFDTILTQPHDQILAILSHELGHWKSNHIPKHFLMFQANTLLSFLAFSLCLNSPVIYKTVGLPEGARPVLIGVLVMLGCVLMPYNTLVGFAQTWLGRRFEFEADRFAVGLGKGNSLEKAIVSTFKDNLEFPIYDPMFSAWHLTHPSLLERLDSIRAVQ